MEWNQDEIARLESEREKLRRELCSLGDLRPGSLVERYRRCGKPGCQCSREGARGHGPTWSLTRSVGGKTVTRVVRPGPALDHTRGHLAEYRRFRRLIGDLLDVSEKLCEARLAAERDAPEAARSNGEEP